MDLYNYYYFSDVFTPKEIKDILEMCESLPKEIATNEYDSSDDYIRRGEIYRVDWGKGKGSEQSGIRPALIIQNDDGNKVSPNTIVASITSAPNKPYPFLVEFTPQESGLDKGGVVDLASILTISKTRLGDKCGQLNQAKMAQIDQAIKISLSLK